VVGVDFFLGFMGFLVGGFSLGFVFYCESCVFGGREKKGENWICFLVNIAKGLHYGL